MRSWVGVFLLVGVLTVAGCGEGEDPKADHLVFSIGDSVASGEGNPNLSLSVASVWSNRPCHRSLGSGQALAAKQVLGADQMGRFVPLGCSGARMETGLRDEYIGIDPPLNRKKQKPQLDELERRSKGHEVDAVMLSIGANDIGFSDIVKFCATLGHEPCQDEMYPDPQQPGVKKRLGGYIETALDRMEVRYRALHERLTMTVPRDEAEKVVVVGYFDPASSPAGVSRHGKWLDGNCRFFLGLVSPAESRWAREELLRKLNQRIHALADEFGWQFVDGVDRKFEHHGICAPGDENWVTTPFESVARHGVPLLRSAFDPETYRELLSSPKGTLHPNKAGHQATAELIEPYLQELVDGND